MYQSVLDFWFQEISSNQWWKVDPGFDQLIAERFLAVHQQAVQSELFEWRREPKGRLAEIIVLDQFSRNIFRGKSDAFAADSLALALAQEALAANIGHDWTEDEGVFLLMPFMHSESPVIHEIAEKLFKERAPEGNYEFELRHKAIIDRFGRFPHRNEILGRESTNEELLFLAQPGSRF